MQARRRPRRSTARAVDACKPRRRGRRARPVWLARRTAAFAAAPKPAMPATFSVPEREGPAPARRRAAGAAASRARSRDQRADALRSAELVGGQGQGVGAERLRNPRRCLPADCTASTCSQPPAPWTSAAVSATGWITPVSLLAEHQGDERPPVLAPSAQLIGQPVEVGDALPIHRPDQHSAPLAAAAARHGVVLGRADDEAADPAGDGAVDRQRIGLGAAAGEGHRSRPARRPGAPTSARAVSTVARAARPAAWTEEGLPPMASPATHRVQRFGPDRRGGVVVQITGREALMPARPPATRRDRRSTTSSSETPARKSSMLRPSASQRSWVRQRAPCPCSPSPRACAARGVQRLVHGDDDRRRWIASAGSREPVAAAGTAHALDQAAPAQAGEQLFEIGQGDLLARGDLGQADGATRPSRPARRARGHGAPGRSSP